jgi:hypothetical protein
MRASNRTLAAIIFGIGTVGFGLLFVGSWQRYQTAGSQFVSDAGRHGFTTFDQMIGLGVLTIVCALVLASTLFARRGVAEAADTVSKDDANDAASSWICSSCHEQNPENFDECWKCHRGRPEEKS